MGLSTALMAVGIAVRTELTVVFDRSTATRTGVCSCEHPRLSALRSSLRSPLLLASMNLSSALQVTTHVQRIANYAGSIVHWIYPTILRRYPNTWSYTVWSISLVGIAMTLAGIVLGCYRSWSSLRNARKPGISPFRRLFRLHHMLGLGAGFSMLTWIFSGWLSVDHGILFPTGNPTAAEVDAFRGEALEDAARQVTLADLGIGNGQSSIEMNAVQGRAVLTGYGTGTGVATTRLLQGGAWTGLEMDTLLRAAKAAWPLSRPAAAVITAQDDYAHSSMTGCRLMPCG